MRAYSRSISTIWCVDTPISAFGLLVVLTMKAYTLERTIITGGPKLGEVENSVSSESKTQGTNILPRVSQQIEGMNQEVIEDIPHV